MRVFGTAIRKSLVARLRFDLGEIDDWLEGQHNVRRLETHVWQVTRNDLPDRTEIVIFEHSPKVEPPS